jgi:hypothetical protein
MRDHGGRAGPARPPRPSRRWWRPRLAGLVGAVVALTLTVAACSGGGRSNGVASLSGSKQPTATTTAKPSSKQEAQKAALEFARCMRQHGIDMPDPQFNGNGITQGFTARRGGKGPDDPKFKAAQQACNKYLPNGGQPTKPNLQEQQQMLAFARCMRQHGIDVPDPGASGGIEVKGRPGTVNPDSPKFKAAEQACQQYEPNGKKSTQSAGGGG